jgi:hypothetical protein
MLYLFAGFPGGNGKRGLHAGGLQYCIEEIEELGLIEHDPAVQYRKKGVFAADTDEMLYPIEYQFSPMLIEEGITWDWFPAEWSFGNGVVMHKTMASPEFKTVVHGTNLTLDEFIAIQGRMSLDVQLEQKHIKHDGWKNYEARWSPNTCPMDAHAVHLTWMVISHRLPTFAYERIRSIIEDGAELKYPERYAHDNPDKYFSTLRKFEDNHVNSV